MPYIACTLQLAHHSTIRVQSSITIQPNTNSLFGPLFGTEANTKRTFGTALNYISVARQCIHCCNGDAWVNGKWQFWECQNCVILNWSTYNLVCMIKSVISPRMPNFIIFGKAEASQQCGELNTWHVHTFHFYPLFLAWLYRKKNYLKNIITTEYFQFLQQTTSHITLKATVKLVIQ